MCTKYPVDKHYAVYPQLAVLMIMASYQTFSGHLKHLTGQTKFGQSNILYIINGKVIKFLIEKPMSGQFSILIVSTELVSQSSDVMIHCHVLIVL